MLIKGKVYCNHCLNEGVETVLDFIKDDFVSLCPKHNKFRGNFYIRAFNEKYQDFVIIRGRNPYKAPEIDKPKATGRGICSICGKENEVRDQNGRGKDGKENGAPTEC